MNDWYNANEHRCYPFKETTATTLSYKEIIDCKFFLKNAKDTKVYLKSRTEEINTETGEDEITYVFRTSVGDVELKVPINPDYKVIKFNKDFGYGFVVFGDTTNDESEVEPL